MAATIYLSLLWGYLILQTPQHFAAFSALVLCVGVLFWVGVARTVTRAESQSITSGGFVDDLSASSGSSTVPLQADEPSLSSSLKKLDALKTELSEQYAQFGKDQTAMNSKGLGTWQRRRKPGSDQR